ncbi:hypothetical protein [Desulfonema magnum]|uniref:Uncharacterized protein n=1 Tax=Desulfonema magnum TaxID=45655 RepID=A0A975BKH4_9BACT|nr:hypothetical protein [Desulfonema magnum]QTA87068.1 Uncharacterized protein dnm_030950 [Desulfonema magnum]
MNEKQPVYIRELSSEEEELLEIGKKIQDAGQDPVKILNYYLEARGTAKKAADIGKQAQSFLMKKWEAFDKAFKEHDDKPK